MRAFLSHSSADKGFVERIADRMRPGSFELDARTFDAGSLNSATIIESLKRCDLFVLFLSRAALGSSYVDFETALGVEFYAKGYIRRFLVICIDEEAFAHASETVKYYSIVRKGLNEDTAYRLIEGHLVTASNTRASRKTPFVGRKDELSSLEAQISDRNRPATKAIFISGNAGSGRRTIARRFYEDQFPEVNSDFCVVDLNDFVGIEEIYRRLLSELRPSLALAQLRVHLSSFSIASQNERVRMCASLVNALLLSREAVVFIGSESVLDQEGALQPSFMALIDNLEARPHPPAIFISPRMIPRRHRRSDVSHVGLTSFDRGTSEKLVSRLLKDEGIGASSEEMDFLIELSDGHPYNILRMLDEIKECGIRLFVERSSEFKDWKHRQSSEYLSSMELTLENIRILALLKIVPELDFYTIVESLSLSGQDAADSLLKLMNDHLLESRYDRFFIAPALRAAIERDYRVSLSSADSKEALSTVATSLAIRIEEGTAPISLVDTAVIASIGRGDLNDTFASAFLLPSHLVWLVKKHYDSKFYTESLRLAKEAISRRDRLSEGALVAAYRYLCLSASRTGNDSEFDTGIAALTRMASSPSSLSNVAFLRGFNCRMKAQVPEAERLFREAYALDSGNISAGREIAALCLARGKYDDAEFYAREAYGFGKRNAFLVDMLVSVLIKKKKAENHAITRRLMIFLTYWKTSANRARKPSIQRVALSSSICGVTIVAHWH